MVLHNKRYLGWFFVLNLVLGLFGTVSFVNQAGAILDHSLEADRLVHGFPLAVLIEMISRPEFGPTIASRGPAMLFALLFMVATVLFLPGVFAGYASTYRLPREDFFRACGRNLWRFIRLMIVAGIVMGIVATILFIINGAIAKQAGESTNEILPFELQMIGLGVIFLVMTTLRIWFDLSEADIVLSDERAVRKSMRAALRHTFSGLFRLLTSYVVTTVVAAVFLVGGIWCWMHFVPATSVKGAFVTAQLTLFLLLIPRFWQRGIAVSYWQQNMMLPAVAVQQVIPPQPVPVAVIPEPTPVVPEAAPGS